MGEVIYLGQEQAAVMTNCKELVKLYTRKNSEKYAEAIEKKSAMYQSLMDEVLGRA